MKIEHTMYLNKQKWNILLEIQFFVYCFDWFKGQDFFFHLQWLQN